MQHQHSSPVRWGILSTGGIAHKFAQDLQNYPEAGAVVAVGSRSKSTSLEFAKEFTIPDDHAHASYEELANDPIVDIIYIATPHSLHYSNALMCLNAGKHVLCEKALVMNQKEAEKLFEVARSKERFFMEVMWMRTHPAMQKLRELLPQIGALQLVQSDFCFDGRNFSNAPRLFQQDLAGGALLDVGVYVLNFAHIVFGDDQLPQKYHAAATFGATGVDESTSMVLEYSTNQKAVLNCSIVSQLSRDCLVVGTRGTVRISFVSPPAASVVTLYLSSGVQTFEVPPMNAKSYLPSLAIEAARCIRSGLFESPIMSHKTSLTIMKQMDTIRRIIGLKYPQDDRVL